jgi:hypothetical protein
MLLYDVFLEKTPFDQELTAGDLTIEINARSKRKEVLTVIRVIKEFCIWPI